MGSPVDHDGFRESHNSSEMDSCRAQQQRRKYSHFWLKLPSWKQISPPLPCPCPYNMDNKKKYNEILSQIKEKNRRQIKKNLRRKQKRYREKLKREMETFEENTSQGGNLPKAAKTVSFQVALFNNTLFEIGSLTNESHDLSQVKTTKHKKETCLFYDVQNRHSHAVMAVNSDMQCSLPWLWIRN